MIFSIKPVVVSTSFFFLFLSVSCLKQEQRSTPDPIHTKELPELFEEELLDFYSKGWKELSDTLSYFYANLLSKGHYSGVGPDGVMYSLEMARTLTSVEASFYIRDSLWMKLSGTLSPPEVIIEACNSTVNLHGVEGGGILADIGKLGFIFQINSEASVPEAEILILMNNSRIGYFSIEPFEYPDYTSEYCLVAHFDDSPLTLCYNDRLGLLQFLSHFFDRI